MSTFSNFFRLSKVWCHGSFALLQCFLLYLTEALYSDGPQAPIFLDFLHGTGIFSWTWQITNIKSSLPWYFLKFANFAKNIPRIGKLPYGAKWGFIERKALLKERVNWNKFQNLVQIPKFGPSSEIWLKFWNLAKYLKFCQTRES